MAAHLGARRGLVLPGLLSFLLCRFLRPPRCCNLFNGTHNLGPLLLEAFPIALLDELGQGRFPWLLLVIVQFAEFLRVQAKLARHLHLSVGEAEVLPRVDPDHEIGGDIAQLGHQSGSRNSQSVRNSGLPQ